MTQKILVVFGTRPEGVKMAPVIKELYRSSNHFDCRVCVTAQHRQMLDQVLDIFEIKPHYDLNVMKHGQSLTNVTCNVMKEIEPVLEKFRPDIVLVHGDTTTTLAASLAAYYQKIPVGHVEAGLRSRNIYAPWPEEMNRILTGTIAIWHFAPTEFAKKNLLREGVDESTITVTGNTVIDALLHVIGKIKAEFFLQDRMRKRFSFLNPDKRLILVTAHRRENFGPGFERIVMALKSIVETHDDVEILFPVHLNPNVQEPVRRVLSGVAGIHLTNPQDYLSFVYLMDRSYFIITDSGGIQEEASALGKPVLVMRETTERPEAVTAGTAKLVGTNVEKILSISGKLLQDKTDYLKMSTAMNPYGDGKAAGRIVEVIGKEIS